MSERDDRTVVILEHNVKKRHEKRYKGWLEKSPEILLETALLPNGGYWKY